MTPYAELPRLQELGITNFLTKPYDTGKLLTVLGSAVPEIISASSKKVISQTPDQFTGHSGALQQLSQECDNIVS